MEREGGFKMEGAHLERESGVYVNRELTYTESLYDDNHTPVLINYVCRCALCFLTICTLPSGLGNPNQNCLI